MDLDEIVTQPLLAASNVLARREVSSVELTRALLARIERLEPKLRSYVTITPEMALAQAERADAELRCGRRRSPLHGVPIALKDIVDTAGVRTTAGTTVMADHVPERDATVAARLREAGAVLLGKLKLTEGAFSEHHPDVAPPMNPWNAEHWPGVSSSGSGVAVAASLCFGALGTDTGGSIRFPSAACGVTGLKPTFGRVSRDGVFPLAASLDHVGPMARTAADCAAVLDAIAGWDPRDPTSSRARAPEYLAGLQRSIRGMRIGVDRTHSLSGTDPIVAESFERALGVLTDLGADVREVIVPATEALVQSWTPACAVETALAHEHLFNGNEGAYGPALRMLIELGRSLPATEYARIQDERRVFCARLAGLFETVDMLALPAIPMTTPTMAQIVARANDPEAAGQLLRFTAPWDFSGSPTLSLPCGFDASGMPLGFQLVGGSMCEDLLLATGDAFQRATDWHMRRPPV